MAELMVLYIDPGTGSMLFTVLIGILGFLLYFVKVLWVKIKFVITRGKVDKTNKNKIPFLIFAEERRYWQVFAPVCRELDKRGVDIVYWTMSQDDPAFDSGLEHLKCEFIGTGNKAYAKLNIVNAAVVLSTTPGLDVYQWKRSKFADYYIHILHGAYDPASYRMFGITFFDAILLSGQYQLDQVRFLENKLKTKQKDAVLTGIPYMDELKARLDRTEVEHGDRKTVLLAPSWGPNSIFNKYGTRVLEALTGTDYDIIVRPHPQSFVSEIPMMEEIMAKFPENEHLHWDRSSDNFDVLCKADILISDFSGVILDYALVFDKPIIYADISFTPDCYDYYWLDDLPWRIRMLPGIGSKLTEESLGDIKALIDSCIDDPEYARGREKVRQETWVNIGEGASRMADYITAKLNAPAVAEQA
ncbi:CDP-Glycerol:Poly(glycerophosphate) glycerophosphotransferase [Ruminococcaceae bacterium YRB3002]|nr:CDP-Glycerol:Poly(glycerophosphate) glycerophosphotransferase [Ruminococcaceae bacterium YRB3002]